MGIYLLSICILKWEMGYGWGVDMIGGVRTNLWRSCTQTWIHLQLTLMNLYLPVGQVRVTGTSILIQQFNDWELDSVASMLSLLYYSMPHRHINCNGVWEVTCFECESIGDAAEDFFLRLLCEWSTVMGLNDSDTLTELPIQFFFFSIFFF